MLSSLLNVVRTGFGHHAERLQQRANSLMPGGDIDVAGGLYERTMALREPQLPRASLLNILPSDLPQPRSHRLSLGSLDDRAKADQALYDDAVPSAPFDLNDALAETSQMYRIENQRRAMKQRLDEEWAAAEARVQAEGREIAMAGPVWANPWFNKTNATPDGDLPPIAPRPNDPGDPQPSQVPAQPRIEDLPAPAQPRMEDPAAGAAAPRPQTPAAIASPPPAAEAKVDADLAEVKGLQRVMEASEALAASEPPAPGVSARKAGSIAAGRAMLGLNQKLAALADDAIDPRAVTLAPPPASQQQPSGHGVVTVTADRPDPMAVRAEAMPVSQTAAPAVVAPYGVKFNEDSTELLSRSPALLNALQTADDLSGRRQQKPPSASAPRADGGTSSAKKQDGDDNGWMLPVLGGAGLLGAGAAAGLALPHLFGGNSQPNPQTPAR
jgi:hypothetical protein